MAHRELPRRLQVSPEQETAASHSTRPVPGPWVVSQFHSLFCTLDVHHLRATGRDMRYVLTKEAAKGLPTVQAPYIMHNRVQRPVLEHRWSA